MTEEQFDRRLSEWLSHGPLDVPRGPAAEAIAYAWAHPRRRRRVSGVREAVMSHLRPAEVQLGAPRRHELLAAGGVAATIVIAVAVMAAGGLLSPDRSAERAVPAAAGTADASVAATAGESSATAGPVPTTDTATALAAITGTWTGTLVRPPSNGGPANAPSHASWGLSLDTILVITSDCVRNRNACGSFEEVVRMPSASNWRCVFHVWFLGADQGSNALGFEMVPDADHWQSCSAERVLVTPLAGGERVVVEEMADGVLSTPGRGVLARSVSP